MMRKVLFLFFLSSVWTSFAMDLLELLGSSLHSQEHSLSLPYLNLVQTHDGKYWKFGREDSLPIEVSLHQEYGVEKVIYLPRDSYPGSRASLALLLPKSGIIWSYGFNIHRGLCEWTSQKKNSGV